MRLRKSSGRMDLCSWIKYRTYNLPKDKAAPIPLRDIQNISYVGILPRHGSLFRQRLDSDLKAIAKVTRFRWSFTIEKQVLLLYKAR